MCTYQEMQQIPTGKIIKSLCVKIRPQNDILYIWLKKLIAVQLLNLSNALSINSSVFLLMGRGKYLRKDSKIIWKSNSQ
jgi:hypothetical protein